MSILKHQLIILGSGPAGYSAALYAARANLDVAIICGNQQGGQLTKTTSVENWPGSLEITGPSLVENMLEQVKNYNVKIYNDHIESVNFKKRPFKLFGEKKYQSDSVIIATGASAKYLNLESEKLFMNKGVSACATCDGFFYKNKIVAVIGGGNTALEEAIYLSNIAKQVYLIHRRDEFRGDKILQQQVIKLAEDKKIVLLMSYVTEEIIGNDKDGVTGIKIKSIKNGKIENVELNGIFIAIGHTPNTIIFNDQLSMTEGYIDIKTGQNGMFTQTSIPGIFACGDVADRFYRQAITSAGSGAMAALDADKYLRSHDQN